MQARTVTAMVMQDSILSGMTFKVVISMANHMVTRAYLQAGLRGISFLVVMKASNMYRSPPR